MTEDGNQFEGEENRNLGNREQNDTDRLDREKNPLGEKITEYIQKARDELKQYEEQKKFYEKRRKREIVLGIVDLLEEHDYPKEWLLIIAQELGDYISTSYIEKILAEKYPDEKKKVEEESTRQITEIPQNDDKIPIELSNSGESMIGAGDDELRNPNTYYTDHTRTEVSAQSRTELEKQAEEGVQEIVKKLQKKVRGLETKCYQLRSTGKRRAYVERKVYESTTRIRSS